MFPIFSQNSNDLEVEEHEDEEISGLLSSLQDISSRKIRGDDDRQQNEVVKVQQDDTLPLNSSMRQGNEKEIYMRNQDLKEKLYSSFSSSTYDNLQSKMWQWNYCGLYAQYAAVGLICGSMNVSYNFCVYYYDGPSNLCANAKNIQMLAWSFKILYAIFTDSYRPFGMRRKPYIITGWLLAIIQLVFLSIFANQMNASQWIMTMMGVNMCVLLADVPSDGYSIELSKLETNGRGQIMATGQFIRWSFSTLAGLFQAFLLNGPTTNTDDCSISWQQCWSWGLSVREYYGLLTICTCVLFIPMCFLRESDPRHIPEHTAKEFVAKIWDLLQNQTACYLIIYVVGIHCFTNFFSSAAIYLQYYIIELTNLQAGLDSISTNLATAIGIRIFQTYLMKMNWRWVSYMTHFLTSSIASLWILAYYNIGGLRNGWFTVFIDVDQSFGEGMSRILYSLTVIELSTPGLEATTYELIASVSNAGMSLSTIFATQLLNVVHASGCTEDDDSENDITTFNSTSSCSSSTSVDLTSVDSYKDSNGPIRFTKYTLLLIGISIVSSLIFTPFLPKNREQCHEWTLQGKYWKYQKQRAILITIFCIFLVLYVILSASLLLSSKTSCLRFFGGSGC